MVNMLIKDVQFSIQFAFCGNIKSCTATVPHDPEPSHTEDSICDPENVPNAWKSAKMLWQAGSRDDSDDSDNDGNPGIHLTRGDMQAKFLCGAQLEQGAWGSFPGKKIQFSAFWHIRRKAFCTSVISNCIY